MAKKSGSVSGSSMFKKHTKKTDLVSPFGNTLRSARLSAGLKQNQVAFQLGLANNSIVSKWESGEAKPSLDSFVELCRLYKKSPNQLLNLKGAPK